MQAEQDKAPFIGAQFFANLNESDEYVEQHFVLMKKMGIRLVRVFLLWAQVESAPDEWDFSLYDRIYNLAAKYELKVLTTLTCEDPPAYLSKKDFYHHHCNLNNPDLQKAAKTYIQKVVGRYAKHPAHYAWSLMNEPEVAIDYGPSTMALFAKWLKEKYKTVAAWNKQWYRPFRHFEDVTINPQDWNMFWMDFKEYIDWQNFVQDNLCMQLSFIRDEIRKYDHNSVTHVHPKALLESSMHTGQQFWKEAEVADTLGASIHPAWDPRFTGDESGKAFACCIDLTRSGADGKPFWVTELQGGPVLGSANRAHTPSPQEFTAYLWDTFGAGGQAVIYWMWHARNMSQEAGDWGIATLDHKPTVRLEASRKVSRILAEQQDFFQNAKREHAKAAIFYNHATEILSSVQKAPGARTPNDPIDSMRAVYYALTEQQVASDFVCASQILRGDLVDYDILYLPYAYALDEDVQDAIADFVRNGGRLWADIPCTLKTSAGEMYLASPHRLAEVFGAHIYEYSSDPDAVIDTDGMKIPGHFCLADIRLESGRAEGSYQNTWFEDRPAIIRNQYGKGQAVLIGTAASLGYAATGNPLYARAITRESADLKSDVLRLRKENRNLIQRVLVTDHKAICILENWGTACETEATIAPQYTKAMELTQGSECSVTGHTLAMQLKRGETVCILLS